MAAYLWDITTAEVLRSLGHSKPDNPTPKTIAIEGWIVRFAGRLNQRLIGRGVVPISVTTVSDDDLYQTCRQAIISRVAAEWVLNNQKTANDQYESLRDHYNEWLEDIRLRPSLVVGNTGHTFKPKTGPTRNNRNELVSGLNRPPEWIDMSKGYQ